MKLRKKRVEDVNLVSTLLDAHEHLDAIARVDPLGVIERLRFIDVSVRAARWADVVRSHGLAPGEHVVVLAERDRAWRAALLGVIEAGCVAVPLPGTTAVDDIQAVAQDAAAALILSHRPRADLEAGPAVVSAEDVDGARVPPRTGSEEDARGAPPDEPALVLYGRDGTGRRGALHTHGSLFAQAAAGERWLGLGAGDSVWTTAADGSAESIWLLLAAWHVGAEVIVVDQQAPPDVVLELLHRLRPTAIWLTDDEYSQLASSDALAGIDLRSIRRALTGDAQAPGVVAFHEAFGTAVAPMLGLVEAGVVAGCAAETADDPVAGITFRGIGLTVVDGEGRELRAGDIGDLAVPGTAPSLFAGYGRDRADAPKSDEWFRVGRRGAIDRDGVVRLAPRGQAAEPEQAQEAAGEDDAGVAAHVAGAALAAEEQARMREAAEAREAKQREEAARAEAARQSEAAKLARREAEREAKARADAEEKRRKQAEREQRESAKAEERRRAEQAKQHAQAEKRRRKQEEKQRKLAERERLETAAAEERRRAEQAERAKREAAAAREALRAEEAARAAREAEEKREADEKRRAEELLRLESERRLEEEREAAARAEKERLEPGIRSMIDHYGFAGAPLDPDSRRAPDQAGQSPALEDRAT